MNRERSRRCRQGIALACAIGWVGCSAPPSLVAALDAGQGPVSDAGVPDAGPSIVGAALAVDELALTGEGALFALLGTALVNDFAAQQIAGGQFLLATQMLDVDVIGQDDEDVRVGVFFAADSDDDATDNFDAANPEQIIVPGTSFDKNGDPLVAMTGTITSGVLDASGALELALPGSIPLPVSDAVLQGTLIPSDDAAAYDFLRDASLRGTLPAVLVAAIPNLLSGMCPGTNMLDLMVNGCGFLAAAQPTVDVDGDGLETFFVDENGIIVRCVDGDGVTEYNGAGCVNDSNIADGYTLEFSLHATRVELVLGE